MDVCKTTEARFLHSRGVGSNAGLAVLCEQALTSRVVILLVQGCRRLPMSRAKLYLAESVFGVVGFLQGRGGPNRATALATERYHGDCFQVGLDCVHVLKFGPTR